ncbi:TetR family transcriptional regulator [Nocardia mexicana]|nr:TetR family transcriptional regulator [Nocardia mexicana]
MSYSRQEGFVVGGRENQKQRTRRALIDAAIALAREGQSPTVAQVAAAAKVSLATAHRYFPNRQSLWADVAIMQTWAARDVSFEDLPADPEERVDIVVRALATAQLGDEVVWREVVRAASDRWFAQLDTPESERIPTRGTNRLDMAALALEPLREQLGDNRFQRLVHAMTMVFGAEAMITMRDTAGLDPEPAIETMAWAARALVRAALAEQPRQ